MLSIVMLLGLARCTSHGIPIVAWRTTSPNLFRPGRAEIATTTSNANVGLRSWNCLEVQEECFYYWLHPFLGPPAVVGCEVVQMGWVFRVSVTWPKRTPFFGKPAVRTREVLSSNAKEGFAIATGTLPLSASGRDRYSTLVQQLRLTKSVILAIYTKFTTSKY